VAAGAATGMLAIITIVIMPITGGIYDFVKKRKVFVLAGFVVCALVLAFAFQASNTTVVWACIIALGIGGGFIASGTRPMIPEIMEKKNVGAFSIAMGMGAMQIAQNLGPTVGAPLFGAIAESFGWFSAGLWLCAPVAILAFICLFFIKVR
jgi:MFS family permease